MVLIFPKTADLVWRGGNGIGTVHFLVPLEAVTVYVMTVVAVTVSVVAVDAVTVVAAVAAARRGPTVLLVICLIQRSRRPARTLGADTVAPTNTMEP